MVNVKEERLGQTKRMSFSKSRFNLELPNLLEVQTKSFKWFLEEGLGEVLRDVSPITDFSGNLKIEFLSYSIDQKPKYTVEECKERDVNYAAPLMTNVPVSVINGISPMKMSEFCTSPVCLLVSRTVTRSGAA